MTSKYECFISIKHVSKHQRCTITNNPFTADGNRNFTAEGQQRTMQQYMLHAAMSRVYYFHLRDDA